jgi:hypothetical protein
MAKKRKGSETTIKVTDGGSLKKVGKEADKASGKFDTFGKSAHSADRAGRGVAQMSSNSTKNFSKLSQGISGGLVPAYATLAAQLFALDALFRFLKDAADFRVLKEGQEAFAAATGTAYKSLAREIQSATDAQVTFAESSQAAAIGMAAGLSPAQLIELSEAAKTVSIALGRDTTDSFNRLVRGVTKAEPELLDELGIILRLEEASIRYAAALGLNKNELTVFQKSQAVTNEVLRQAEEKFGAMNDIQETTTNQIAKMAIAFDEVLNVIKTVIGPVAEFFGTFLVNNIGSASMAIGVFAATMLKKLVPAFQQVDAAKLGKGMSTRMAGDTDTGGMFSPGKTKQSQARYARLQAGEMNKKDIADYQKSLNVKKSSFVNYNKFTKATQKRTYYELKAMQNTHIANEKVGFKRSYYNWRANLNLMKSEYGVFVGTIKAYSQGLATALNTALGVIGWFGIGLMAIQMAWQKWGHLLKDTNAHLEEFQKRVADSTSKLKSLNEEMAKVADVSKRNIIKDWEANVVRTGNALNSMNVQGQIDDFNDLSALKFYDREAWDLYQGEFEQFLTNMTVIQPALQKYMKAYYEGRFTGAMQERLNKDVQGFISAGQAQQEYARGTSKLIKEQNKLVQGLPKVKYQDYLQTIQEMIKAQEIVAASKEVELNSLEKESLAYNKILAQQSELVANLYELQAERQLLNVLQEEDIRMKKEAIALQQSSVFKKFQGTETQDRILVIEKQRQVVQRKQFDLQVASHRLEMLKMKAGPVMIKGLTKQVELQQDMLDLEMDRLRAIELQTDAVFKTYNKIFTGFQKDFASAISSALRGDDGGFDKMQENLRKTITDAIGESLSNQMMENFLGPILPRTLAQKLVEAHSTGADAVGKAMSEGADAFTSEWETGGKIKFAFDTFITQLNLAMGTYKEAQGLNLLARNKRLEADRAEQMAEHKEGPGVRRKDGIETDEYRNWAARQMANPVELIASSLKGEDLATFRKEAGILGPAGQLAQEFREALVAELKRVQGLDPESEEGSQWRKQGNKTQLWQRKDFSKIAQELNSKDPAYARFFEGAFSDAGEQGAKVTFTEMKAALEEIDIAAGLRKDSGVNWKSAQKIDMTTIAGKDFAKRQTPSYGAAADILDQDKLSESLNRLYKSDQYQQDQEKKFGVGGELDKSTTELIAANDAEIIKLGLTIEALDRLTLQLEGKTPDEVDKIIGDKNRITLSGDVLPEEKTEAENLADNKFVTGAQDILGGASMILGAAGRGEEAAKVMKVAAALMMTVAIMDRARAAMDGADTFGKFLMQFIGGGGGRYGGIMSPSGKSFGTGGIAKGPQSGYGAVLHGTEAVVPLGNDRSIPVEMKGGGNVNNTSVTVNMAEGSTTTTSDEESGRQFAQAIQASVLETISQEQRSGGLLDYGGG